MTKKWLMYVVTGLMCCGVLVYAAASKSSKPSAAATQVMLNSVDKLIRKDGESQVLLDKKTRIEAQGQVGQPAAVKPMEGAPATGMSVQQIEDPRIQAGREAAQKPVGRVATEEERALISGAIPGGLAGNTPVQLEQNAQEVINALLAQIETATAEGRDVSVYKNRINEIIVSMSNGRDRDRLDETGGPDPWGYTYVDNQAPDTATFNWEEADANWTELLGLADADDNAELITWANTFTLYGTSATSAWVNSNGTVDFVNFYNGYFNQCLFPDFGPTGAALLPLMDDLHTINGTSSDGGRVVYRDFGDHVTVTWDSVGRFASTTESYDFQIAFWPANGRVRYQYRTMDGPTTPSAKIGIREGNTAVSSYLDYRCSEISDAGQAFVGRTVWFIPPLNPPTGRCCYWDGVNENCDEDVSPVDCGALGGLWGGANSTCASAPCEVGRCCYDGGLACGNFMQAHCADLQGVWTAGITCESNPCPNCNVNCGPFDIVEEDESDTCNLEAADPDGGCNNLDGPRWLDIACGDTVCGMAFTYINCNNGFQYRDTDWIRFTTTGPSIISYSAVAKFDGLQMFILDGGYCTNFILYSSLFLPTCGEVGTLVTECLPPGDYIIWAGTGNFGGLPYGNGNNTYRAWVECTPCVIPTGRCCYYDVNGQPACATNFQGECNNLGGFWTQDLNCVDDPCVFGRCCYNNGSACADMFDIECGFFGGVFDQNLSCQTEPCENLCELDCDPLDIVEPDDFPGYCDSFGANDPDGGCNVVPPVYLDIACGDWICGTAFTCDAIFYRDTDWFRFTIDEAQDVTVTAEAEFSPMLFGIVDISDCGFAFFVTNNFIFDCLAGQATATAFCLPAGTYAAWAGPLNGSGLPTPVQYRLQVTCAPPTNCPVGRCCYDEGLACEDNTAPECDALGGTWEAFNSCANGPCPVPVDNDDCLTAEQIVTVNNGSVTVLSGAEGATPTCAAPPCADNCPFFPTSSGNDQFYYFTLTECRLLAIEADNEVFFCDPNINVYNDGDCCGTAISCNDDWGCSTELDALPWLPPFLRPVAGFGSMVADSFGPGTYYIRAGHYGAGWGGNYDLTVWDFGPCVVAPCDPVVDLTINIVAVSNLADHVKLFWTAPQDDEFKIWSTTNMLNDGNPDDGADADFTLEFTTGLLLAGPQSWDAPAGFVGIGSVGAPKFYVVTAVCEPFQAPVGRCCYGEFLCADNTEEECNELAGSWTQFMSCDANPCPPPPPANDECGNAIEVFNAVPLGVSNIDATGSDITGCTFDDIFDVWYVFNAASTDPITASVCSAYDIDTGLSAWSDCGGTELACIDDFCGLGSEITFVPPAAGNVYIRFAGYNSQMGTATLTVTQ